MSELFKPFQVMKPNAVDTTATEVQIVEVVKRFQMGKAGIRDPAIIKPELLEEGAAQPDVSSRDP